PGSVGRLTDANGINDSGAIVGRFERADSSARGVLLVPPAAGGPTLQTAPASQSVPTGASATFAVTPDGNPPFTYQWLRNRVVIPGATSATLNFPSTQPSDSGVYSVRITNAAGSLLTAGAVLAVNVPVMTFTDLGTLGGDSSEVAAINAQGVVVGRSAISPGVEHAFRFAAGRMTDLGTLGGRGSAATQINDAGEIVGWAELPSNVPHAFVYRDGRMTDLGTLPGTTSSQAYAINAAGVIVGQAAAGFRSERAVSWSDGRVEDLNTRFSLPAGRVLASARGITSTGAIMGFMYVEGDPVAHVFITSGTSVVDLGRMGGALFGTLQLTGSNEALQFTGMSSSSGGFLYTPSTAALTSLGSTVTAHDVNARGDIVGGRSLPSGQLQAYWRVGDRMIDLNDLAIVEGDRPLAVAKAINDQGWIAGDAFTQALSSRAFLLRPTAPARALNLSVRVALGATRPLVVGFVKRGPGRVLLRAIGPGLRPFFGDAAVLAADPRLDVYDSGGNRFAANDDWGGTAAVSEVFAAVGAFALAPSSADAALLTAPTGAVTAHANTRSAGIGLVELYAVDAGPDAALINLSARYQVGVGAEVLVAGLVVGPGAAKTFLIRGVGPGLAAFGVTGVLADPVLDVFDRNGARIDRNDDWPATIAPIARQVGAFELTGGSKDAALVVTLGPGNYSAQLSGVGSSTGEGLIEIYDLTP
ncbi:MAG TPA: immunoglobulin domain-containing protein, partial [Opitutaceae bacterium]|nr:immunoglobulin domain-containing protein [Opitutaceae bacterium]